MLITVFSLLFFLREGAGGIRVKLSEFAQRIPPLRGVRGVFLMTKINFKSPFTSS
jgi:hypothetical protein